MSAGKKVRVTFSSRPVIWISVRGEGGGAGILPKDGGLTRHFSEWRQELDIIPAVFGGAGPGFYSAGFAPADAERVIAWLREQGAEEVEP